MMHVHPSTLSDLNMGKPPNLMSRGTAPLLPLTRRLQPLIIGIFHLESPREYQPLDRTS